MAGHLAWLAVLLLLNTENLGFDIESRALGKSYPMLKYPVTSLD